MVEVAQQWWRTEAIIEYHRIALYSIFVKQIDILPSFLRKPHTDRFPDDVLKKLWRNRNRDSCEKNATGTENAGIRRIPAGIRNLDTHFFVTNMSSANSYFLVRHFHCCLTSNACRHI
jgi:hypothetical protein